MRKVIVTNIVTLDGFYAGEGGNPLVLNMDAAFDAYNLERMRAASTVVLGHTSFELFGSYWPMIADAPADPANPALSDTNREFSRLYRDVPKIIVGDAVDVDEDHPWRDSVEIVGRADAAARLDQERRADAGDIAIFGSRMLWNALLAERVVDELHLLIGPSGIGSGVGLFDRPTALDLLDARPLEASGNVLHRYAVPRTEA